MHKLILLLPLLSIACLADQPVTAPVAEVVMAPSLAPEAAPTHQSLLERIRVMRAEREVAKATRDADAERLEAKRKIAAAKAIEDEKVRLVPLVLVTDWKRGLPNRSHVSALEIAMNDPTGEIVIGHRVLRRTKETYIAHRQPMLDGSGRGDIEASVWSLEPVGNGSGSVERWEHEPIRLFAWTRGQRQYMRVDDGFLVESLSGSKYRWKITAIRADGEVLWTRRP